MTREKITSLYQCVSMLQLSTGLLELSLPPLPVSEFEALKVEVQKNCGHLPFHLRPPLRVSDAEKMFQHISQRSAADKNQRAPALKTFVLFEASRSKPSPQNRLYPKFEIMVTTSSKEFLATSSSGRSRISTW
jgi:hypothetical protein